MLERIHEAEGRYWNAYHVIFDFRAAEQRDAAQYEDLWAVHDQINTAWAEAPGIIENSEELANLQAQIPIAEQSVGAWEEADEYAWTKQDEWNNRDTSLDDSGDNDDLQDELTEALRLRDEAEATRNEENDLRGEYQTAYD